MPKKKTIELKPPELIVIKSIDQIIQKMSSDGDLREHEFDVTERHVCCEGDDLGFYQQACEFLISMISQKSEKKCKKCNGKGYIPDPDGYPVLPKWCECRTQHDQNKQ